MSLIRHCDICGEAIPQAEVIESNSRDFRIVDIVDHNMDLCYGCYQEFLTWINIKMDYHKNLSKGV